MYHMEIAGVQYTSVDRDRSIATMIGVTIFQYRDDVAFIPFGGTQHHHVSTTESSTTSSNISIVLFIFPFGLGCKSEHQPTSCAKLQFSPQPKKVQ